MARGIGVFGAKGWPKRVNIRQGAGECFAFELAAHRQVSRFAEKIGLRLFVDVSFQGSNPKHFAGPFAIARRNNRRMDIYKIAALKKLVNGERQPAAQSENRSKQI